MTLLEILALLLGIAAIIGLLKSRLLGPPPAIGLTAMALLAAVAVVALDAYLPGLRIGVAVRGLLRAIDLRVTLTEAMLCILLFAAATHVDLAPASRLRLRIALMALLGVLISTLVVGGALWLAATVLGLEVPLALALAFGALIAATDPVAVFGMLRTVRAPAVLEARVMGESAFTAAAAVLVFTILLAIATGAAPPDWAGAAGLAFLVQIFGGIALGLGAGAVVFLLLRWMTEPGLAVLFTLALLVGVYAGAGALALNAPLASFTAGLLVGLETRRLPMAEGARAQVSQFWLLADALVKTALFVVLGLEVAELDLNTQLAAVAGAAVFLAIFARWLAVAMPIAVLRLGERFPAGARRVLVWGGLRGGLAVALALSLPLDAVTRVLLALTAAVVAFSIIVQGLTLAPIARRRIRREQEAGLYEEARPAVPPEPIEPTWESPPLEAEPEPAPPETVPEPEPEPAPPETVAEPEPEPAPPETVAEPEPEPLPPEREPEPIARPERAVADAPPAPREPARASAADIPRPDIVADPGEAPPADEGTAPSPPPLLDAGRAPAPPSAAAGERQNQRDEGRKAD